MNIADLWALRGLMKEADVVLNTVDPTNSVPSSPGKPSKPELTTWTFCDDYEATLEQLEMDEERKGVTVLTGMGSSPGVAKFCSQLLDQTDEIHVYHVHGGKPEEGPAVITTVSTTWLGRYPC